MSLVWKFRHQSNRASRRGNNSCGNVAQKQAIIDGKESHPKPYIQQVTECHNCGARGPWGVNEADAINLWDNYK